ncbi:relaxin-3-like [Osmerus mordax]|uniref:relaxin-3-like n=1 Tax=Osmerus mordax TaxID=8014 RepID=UPI0035103E61
MRVMLLPLLLLCVLAVGWAEPQEGVRALRLCGRELLRAVVYTCGGSRWRRFPAGEDSPDDNVDQYGLSTWMAERRKRDISGSLIRLCCQQGCNKSDLSALC